MKNDVTLLKTLLVSTMLTAAIMVSAPAAAEVLELTDKWKDGINKDKTLKEKIVKKAGLDGDWVIQSVKLIDGRVDAVSKKLDLPDGKMEHVTSTKVENCAGIEMSRDVGLNTSITNSSSVTKSETFGTSVEATVGADFLLGNASVTAGASYDYTKGKTDETSKTVETTDSVHVSFPAEVSVIVATLDAKKVKVDRIPYTLTFTPNDKTKLKILFARPGKGKACIYKDMGYKGGGKCYDLAADKNEHDVPWVGDKWNDEASSVKLSGPVGVEVWHDAHHGGKHKTYTKNANFHGFNDVLSSLKVFRLRGTHTLAWSDIKGVMPDKLKTFTLKGTVTLSDTNVDDTVISTYKLSDDEVKKICADHPDSASGTSKVTAKAGVVEKTLSRNEFERLLKAGKLRKIK